MFIAQNFIFLPSAHVIRSGTDYMTLYVLFGLVRIVCSSADCVICYGVFDLV
jgi:hypothetical protein